MDSAWHAAYAVAMTTTPKRKPSAKPAPKLHGLRRPISLTLPPELVDEVDAIAATEDRTRVKVIEIAVREFVRSYPRDATRRRA